MLLRGVCIKVKGTEAQVIVEDVVIVKETAKTYKIERSVETLGYITNVPKKYLNSIDISAQYDGFVSASIIILVDEIDEGPQTIIKELKSKLTEVLANRLEVATKMVENLNKV